MGGGTALALRSEWLKTRQQLLNQIKRQVAHRLGRPPRDLNLYIRQYNSEFSRPWRRSSHRDLLAAVAQSKVVLGADFHAFSQSQRIHLRILRDMPETRDVVLLLEALTVDDDPHIQNFLRGELSEAEFLVATKWETRWGFPFANYRPLFELARERGFQVAGLSPRRMASKAGSLQVRDRFAAQVIGGWEKKDQKALIYVVVGDLHLAARHLPAALKREVGSLGGKVLTILQNSEHLYFRLARLGKEHQIDVMRALGGRFCVLSSPPWVKWQSYLIYLEQTYDRDLEAGELDYTDYVASLAVFISQELGIEPRLEDLAVFTPQGPLSWRKVIRGLSRQDKAMAEGLIRQERSFLVPQNRVLFLARPSINHAATLAGQYLHARLADWNRLAWRFPMDFEALIWIEGFGYFCSKLINHKRKADTLEDLKKQLADSDHSTSDVLRLALSQRLLELGDRKHPLRFRPKKKAAYLEAARRVGHMLGERLYKAYAEGQLSRSELIAALQKNPLDSEFSGFYRRWIERYK